MTHVLSEQYIYKTSFSKYDTAYQKVIYPNLRKHAKGAVNYA